VTRRESRLVFVVGSPRSGTTFVGNALGAQPGFVDLGEVPLLKAAVPRLVRRPVEQQAREIRMLIQLVRNLAVVHGLRQGRRLLPPGAGLAQRRAGRQQRREAVLRRACTILGRAGPAGRVRGGQRGDPRRVGLAQLRHRGPSRAGPDDRAALRVARGGSPGRGTARRAGARRRAGPLADAFGEVRAHSIGRWRRDLTPEQLADVEAEAGVLLAALGYS
jgi:hypothetical protein